MAGMPVRPAPSFEKKVGIVGLGRMGANIAHRLYHARVSIGALYDKDPSVPERLAREYRTVHAKSLVEVTAHSEVVLTVVSDDQAVDSIYSESGDSLLVGAGGLVFIECSTVSPKIHEEISKRCHSRRAHFIEACMAGSFPQAHDGSLFLILGGDKKIADGLAPLLTLMGRNAVHVGDIPRAAQIKLLVNMLMNINTAALAEGLALGDALGIPLEQLRDIFSKTGAASRVLLTDGEDMQKRQHSTYFSAEHARKDSGLALALAAEKNLELPLAEETKRQYDRLCSAGLGHIDKSGISELTFAERRKKYAAVAEKA